MSRPVCRWPARPVRLAAPFPACALPRAISDQRRTWLPQFCFDLGVKIAQSRRLGRRRIDKLRRRHCHLARKIDLMADRRRRTGLVGPSAGRGRVSQCRPRFRRGWRAGGGGGWARRGGLGLRRVVVGSLMVMSNQASEVVIAYLQGRPQRIMVRAMAMRPSRTAATGAVYFANVRGGW